MADEIGSLEPGKCADIVIHGTDIPEVHPPFDPFTNLIYSARAKSVKDVMVDGEWVVKDRRAVNVNEEEIYETVDSICTYFAEKTGYRLYTNWKVL